MVYSSQHGVRNLLAICRSIVGHFKHSSVACHKMAQIQENLDLLQHKLKQDVPTRSNSAFYKVESILEQKMALAAYSTENKHSTVTPTQLELAERIVLVLSLIEVM